jgi:F5/8 type C domain
MKRSFVMFLVYLGLTIALTAPLILSVGTVIPSDPGDPALNTWILWWNAHAMPYTATWWNAPAFFPVPGSLAFSEHLLGLSLLSTPIQWLGGGPQLAYNIVFLLTFPLCAFGAYLLARELTGREDAAFIAGLLFGFAPYRIAHLPQIQCLAAFPMPFALLGLHRYLRDPRKRWLALFGAGWLLQAACNGYYMLFFAVVVGAWMIWFATPVPAWRTFAAILAAWVVASLPLAPLLLQYRTIHEGFGFTRDFGTIRDFGADVGGLLNAARALTFWGWLHVYKRAEGELFPGLTIAVLLAAGCVMPAFAPSVSAQRGRPSRWTLFRRVLFCLSVATALIALSALLAGPWRLRMFGWQWFSVANPVKPLTYALGLGVALALTGPRLRQAWSSRSVLGFYSVSAFLTWLFSLGPAPTLLGKPLMYRGPYALLMLLPGFNALRVPARFWMMTTLCLAVVGAMVFDALAARVGSKRLMAAAIVAVGVLADGWVTGFPLAKAPAVWQVERCSPDLERSGPSRSALLELPLGDPFRDVAAMYRSMSHARPVVNGYSGYFPPHYAALRFGLSLRDDDVLTQLASHGATDVVIDAATDEDGRWRRYVTSHAGVQVVCSDEGRTLYRLPSPPALPSAAKGGPLPIAALRASVNDGDVKYMIDNDRTTRWQSGPQTDRTVMNIDLGTERSISGVQLLLGPFVEDFPRALSIEVLGSGAVWQQLYRGGAAGRAFVGAFEAPKDVPLTFEFAPVSARYVRLRLLANDDTYYWSVAELKVLGSQ